MTDGYKILDNGAAENAAVPPRALMDWAKTIDVDEVIVPDVMGNCDATIEQAREFARFAHPMFKYMGVLQGTNVSEWLKCWNAFDALDYIDVIGFPRYMGIVDGYKQQRYSLLSALMDKDFFADRRPVEVHCLGAIPTWIREVVALSELPVVRSIDTSAPAAYAIAGRQIDEVGAEVPRPLQFFDNLPMTSIEEKLYGYNIDTYFGWAGYRPGSELPEPTPPASEV